MKNDWPGDGAPRVCAAARRAARAVTQLYDLVLSPTGLRATQFIILRSVAQHGEVAQWSLSREHSIAIETLSRRLAGMRKSGWVALRISGPRREHVYSITPDGREILARALPFWERAEARLAEAHARTAAHDLAATVQMLNLLAAAAQEGAVLRTTNGTDMTKAKAAHT